MNNRVVAWFSCGASSAIAAKVACERYGAACVVVNVNMEADEHSDNIRFRHDVEKWLGREILQVSNPKFSSIDDVFLKTRYIVGPTGAACTKRLKRDVYEAFFQPGDRNVVGFTSDERDRIAAIEARYPANSYLWLLADVGISKQDCFHILTAAGIELPEMYRLGFNHDNCIGCVKGGMGYWNKIRKLFPEVFRRRAAVERLVGASIINGVYLDELDPEAGNGVPEPKIDCGLFCEGYADLIQVAVNNPVRV